MVRTIIGKSTFESKDKTKRYYKVVVLEPTTAKQRGNGRYGFSAVDYFIDKGLFQDITDDFENFPQADLEYYIVNGRAELTSIQMVK